MYCLRESFTHYDFHSNNVLLYKHQDYGYITYHYHSADKEITFNSQYIAKIIDYGRCFYEYSKTDNSDVFYKQLCKSKDCSPRCGMMYGHEWFNKKDNFYFIGKKANNISHDLRFANSIKNGIEQWSKDAKEIYCVDLFELLQKIRYGQGSSQAKQTQYGTQEVLLKTYKKNDPYIYNVIQMKKALDFLMETTIPKDTYYKNVGYTKLGDLHIYEDKPMNFIPDSHF